jgi:hypothetical protein
MSDSQKEINELKQRLELLENISKKRDDQIKALEHKAVVDGPCPNGNGHTPHSWSGPGWARYCYFCGIYKE